MPAAVIRLSALLILIVTTSLAPFSAWSAETSGFDSDPWSIAKGRKIWFENTYGGEKFFQFLAHHPDPQKKIEVGFENVINTPRAERFQKWGTINDPDCRANPAGGPDLCAEPSATGVVGLRKFPGPAGKPMIGVACASCHAGFSPLNPPRNLNEPEWENIHPTIGNQYLDSGKIFAANLPPTDVRRLMFAGWPKGTVDTTLLFNDNIMNPGVITAFWNLKHRPLFDVGLEIPKFRAGQGGEDDLGGDIAAMRVYTNIGVCFAECVAPNPKAPIDIAQCRKSCADFPPQKDLDDLVGFLRSIRAPHYPKPVFLKYSRYESGRRTFQANCASCHNMEGDRRKILSNDEVNPLISDTENATHSCRVRTSNWEEGKVWAQFSSQVYKNRIAEGKRGYRTMPLTGIWATTPFLHNQSIGEWAAPNAPYWERGQSYERSMNELLKAERTPVVFRSPIQVGPFPAGTPLSQIFSRDPVTHQLLCEDVVENKGHHYGSGLSAVDKEALIYWLKFQ